MSWDWAYVASFMPKLVAGAIITLQATVLGSLLALTLGLVFAVARRSRRRWIRWPVVAITDFVRSTPLLVQLFVLFFMLPQFGIVLSPLVAGVIGLGVHYACYTAEVYRAGVESVPRSQWEAAVACNLSPWQTWTRIILPQVFRPIIAPLANYVNGMFKETPLLSAITVVELMTQARNVANYTYRYIEPITMVGLFFLLLSIPATILVHRLEKRFGRIEH